MATPRGVTWQLEPHTRAKHAILRRYLDAWLPILSRSGLGSIVYLDGFAGPGSYQGGADGSPVISIKAALAQAASLRGEVHFVFVERDHARAENLRQVVERIALPRQLHVHVMGGRPVEAAFDDIDQLVPRLKGQPVPMFAFLDPLGWTGIPFDLVCRILSRPRSEIFVNFMYEEINRFILHRDQTANFDSLFGTPDWRGVAAHTLPKARKDFLRELYYRQLRERGRARFVRSFEMRNGRDVTDYFLFFATNHEKGMARMKEAMWRTDPSGEFQFSDATNPAQQLLFGAGPDFADLRERILSRFDGKEASVGEIEHFVLADTPYRETHYKGQVLRPLEQAGRIEVVGAAPNRRAGTYPDKQLVIHFLRLPSTTD